MNVTKGKFITAGQWGKCIMWKKINVQRQAAGCCLMVSGWLMRGVTMRHALSTQAIGGYKTGNRAPVGPTPCCSCMPGFSCKSCEHPPSVKSWPRNGSVGATNCCKLLGQGQNPSSRDQGQQSSLQHGEGPCWVGWTIMAAKMQYGHILALVMAQRPLITSASHYWLLIPNSKSTWPSLFFFCFAFHENNTACQYDNLLGSE